MKELKYIIFLNLFFIVKYAQAEVRCEKDNLSDQVNSLKTIQCEAIDKNSRCNANKIDSDSAKNLVTRMLDYSSRPETIEQFRKNWKLQLSVNPAMEKYYDYGDAEKLKNLPPTPILEWFNDKNFADSGKKTEELKQSFINKYVEYSQKFGCTVNFSHTGAHVEVHPSIKKVMLDSLRPDQQSAVLSKMYDDIKKTENIKAAEDYIKKINEKSVDTFYLCTNKPDKQIIKQYYDKEEFPACAGNFKKFFKDNQFEFSENELSKIYSSPESAEITSCIKDRLSKGAKIHHISIDSSASSLNNTGIAAEKFCKKGFLELSKARAENAKQKILPELFKNAGFESFDLKNKIQINPNGSNGDGTSGACVYLKTKSESEEETLNPFYNSKAGKEELDANKYVNIQVTFENNTNLISNKESFYQPQFHCKTIKFNCAK